MNIGGGEAAEQLVRMMLSGGEMTVRLGGSALKNMLALTMALAKDHRTISGKVNLGRMLKETRDLRTFPMTKEQYSQFQKLARKQKVLFAGIHDKDEGGKFIDVVTPVTELERVNQIFERMREAPQKGRNERVVVSPQRQQKEQDRQRPKEQTREAPERQAPQQRQAVPSREENVPERPQRGQSRPRTDRKVVVTQSGPAQEKKSNDSPLRQGSPDTRASSAASRTAGNSRTTSERPSVELRLHNYKAALAQEHKAPSRVKSRTKNATKSLTR